MPHPDAVVIEGSNPFSFIGARSTMAMHRPYVAAIGGSNPLELILRLWCNGSIGGLGPSDLGSIPSSLILPFS